MKRSPNVIIIFCDDLGYGDIGCFGSEANSTPRLDQMAAEGVRFTDFYVSSPVCSPSRASLMTGCYSQRVGLAEGITTRVLRPGDPIGLNPDEITIADVLKKQGYATHCTGKWHLGDQPAFLPTRHGFDSYFGIPYSNDMADDHPMAERFGFPPLPLMTDERVVEQRPDQSTITYRYTEDAVNFIREHRDQPFFLYFAHLYVHVPLYAPEEFLSKSRNGVYGASVEFIDWSTGRILDTLRELGLDGNTLVLFTSDNGATSRDGSSNAPLRGRKTTTWEGGMRVPCIARWPGKIPAGSTCTQLATTMDLMPTLARLSGGDVPSDRRIDGADITPLLFGEKDATTPHEAFFYYNGRHLEAVRHDRWKLHLKESLLYDLRTDVGENHDLASKHPDVVAHLRTLAQRGVEDLGDGERVGRNLRPCGRVNHPVRLTLADDAHYD